MSFALLFFDLLKSSLGPFGFYTRSFLRLLLVFLFYLGHSTLNKMFGVGSGGFLVFLPALLLFLGSSYSDAAFLISNLLGVPRCSGLFFWSFDHDGL